MIAVVVVGNQQIVVAVTGGDGKATGLVGIH